MDMLLGLVGLPASIAVVFTAIVGAFTWLEKESSPQARQRITAYLRDADWTAIASHVPNAFSHLFVSLFGERHLSRRCLRNSVRISIAAMVILLTLGALFSRDSAYPAAIATMKSQYAQTPGLAVIALVIAFATSLAIDYANLFKSRVLIRSPRMNSVGVFTLVLFVLVDIFLTLIIWTTLATGLSVVIAALLAIAHAFAFHHPVDWTMEIVPLWSNLTAEVIRAFVQGPFHSPGAALLYASIVPSAWFVLYILSMRFAPAVKYMKLPLWLFNIEEHPLRSLGIVAGTIAGVVVMGFSVASRVV
jgi:hypothetical protein